MKTVIVAQQEINGFARLRRRDIHTPEPESARKPVLLLVLMDYVQQVENGLWVQLTEENGTHVKSIQHPGDFAGNALGASLQESPTNSSHARE